MKLLARRRWMCLSPCVCVWMCVRGKIWTVDAYKFRTMIGAHCWRLKVQLKQNCMAEPLYNGIYWRIALKCTYSHFHFYFIFLRWREFLISHCDERSYEQMSRWFHFNLTALTSLHKFPHIFCILDLFETHFDESNHHKAEEWNFLKIKKFIDLWQPAFCCHIVFVRFQNRNYWFVSNFQYLAGCSIIESSIVKAKLK